MTRPTLTQGAQSEAARVPRVSHMEDGTLAEILSATIVDLEQRLAEAERVIKDYLARIARQSARADALQARLTEAEQRAAAAGRRGFEAGRDAAVKVAYDLPLTMPKLDQYAWNKPFDQRVTTARDAADAIRFLAPAVPQEGETTP